MKSIPFGDISSRVPKVFRSFVDHWHGRSSHFSQILHNNRAQEKTKDRTNERSGTMTTEPSSNDEVWKIDKAVEGQPPNIILQEGKGNGLHLSVVLRKYTGARLQVKGYDNKFIKIDLPKLYDALGLLRSLQYDVDQFNSVSLDDTDKDATTTTNKYKCFRLSRQAAAFGYRLPAAGTTKVEVLGLASLIEYIEQQNKPTIEAARQNIANGVVGFTDLQEYFTPGKVLVDHGVGTGVMVPTLMRVRACYYSRGRSLFGIIVHFHVAVEFVVAVGDESCAVVEAQFPFPEYESLRSTVSDVDMFTVPSEQELASLASRGKRYQTFCGSSGAMGSGVMVEYNAGTFLPTSKGSLVQSGSSRAGSYGQSSRASGRMVVDIAAAWSRGVHCANHQGVASDAVVNVLKLYGQQRSQKKAMEATMDQAYSTGAQTSSDGEQQNDLLILPFPLPDSLVGMTWPLVSGFSLQARTWGSAMVHGLADVVFNESAFTSLVMPPARKKLIEALVTSHDHLQSADVIAGKGEASIFLLHGNPGTGKTLTAEAIAEMLHRPLYVVSFGELGTSPETLEARLTDVFDLCGPWKALVLIDEAEMLLEKRTKNDIVRNAMVCVMLRLLEYYSGLLFLTTNRVESLDPAFQSRVTCALRYEDLSANSRKEIWQNMMARLKISIDGIDFDELAQHEINGRQIKNTLQLAMALSRHENKPLGQEQLRATLEITNSFIEATTTNGE